MTIFYALVGGITWSWQIYFNQLYATSIGYNDIEKGWLFGVIRLINSFLIIRLLHIEKLFSKRNSFMLFPLLVVLASIPTIIPYKSLGTFLLFIMTLSGTLRFIVFDRFVNEEFDSRYRATALSALNFCMGLVFIAFVSGFGSILDQYSTNTVYVLMGVIVLFVVFPLGIVLYRNSHSSH